MQFFLNEIFPNSILIQDAINAIQKTVKEYNNLYRNFPNDVEGIVTTTDINNIKLSKDINLSDCLNGIVDRILKGFAYSLFIKHPIDDYSDVNIFLEENIEYHLILEENKIDAMYVKLAFNTDGILFSLKLHNDFAKDSLKIIASDDSTFEIDNLYGDSNNTKYIKNAIQKDIESRAGNFERLKLILDKFVFSTKFTKEFESVSREVQEAVIEGFRFIKECKNNNTNIEETILRDVTPPKENEISLKELKLRKPIPKRIYFSEIDGKYYIASLEKKPLKDGKSKEQDNHIKSANSRIKELKRMD